MNHLPKLADDELVALYVSGDSAAFDTLLSRYKDRLYTYIFYAVHNEDLANDLFQETFVKVIVTLQQGRYKADGKFYAWLTRIAHNIVIDQFRTEQAENTTPSDEMERFQYDCGKSSSDAAELELEAEYCNRQAGRLIDELPANQQEVVRMRIYENMSFKDIAEKKGMSINTALGRMHYAILNMRRMANERRINPIFI